MNARTTELQKYIAARLDQLKAAQAAEKAGIKANRAEIRARKMNYAAFKAEIRARKMDYAAHKAEIRAIKAIMNIMAKRAGEEQKAFNKAARAARREVYRAKVKAGAVYKKAQAAEKAMREARAKVVENAQARQNAP